MSGLVTQSPQTRYVTSVAKPWQLWYMMNSINCFNNSKQNFPKGPASVVGATPQREIPDPLLDFTFSVCGFMKWCPTLYHYNTANEFFSNWILCFSSTHFSKILILKFKAGLLHVCCCPISSCDFRDHSGWLRQSPWGIPTCVTMSASSGGPTGQLN